MALASSAGTGNQNGDLLFDEPALSEVVDELLVNARIKVKVEAFQSLVAAEASTTQTQAVLPLFTAPGFILNDQGEKLRVGELFLDCLPITCVEAFKQS